MQAANAGLTVAYEGGMKLSDIKDDLRRTNCLECFTISFYAAPPQAPLSHAVYCTLLPYKVTL